MKSSINNANREYKISAGDFHKIFDSLTLGFALCEFIFDKHEKPKDYKFLRINAAFEKQSGMKKASTINNTIRNIYPDIEQSWIDRLGSVVINNRKINFIHYNHNTNRTYSVNAHPFSENKFVMFIEDITELAKAKKDIRKRDKQYKKLFNSMLDMFQVIELIYDEDGHVIDYKYLKVNNAYAQFVNKRKEEMIGKRAKEIFGVVEQYWLKAFENLDKTGKPKNFENFEAALNKYYHVNAWKVEKGQVAIVFKDITERKLAEKTIFANNRLIAFGEMASSITHDFNNSLQAIIINIEVAKIKLKLSDATLECFNNISSEVRDMASRVEEFRRFVDTKYDSNITDVVDFNALITESIKQLQPLLKDNTDKKGLSIKISTNYGDIPEIQGHKDELKNVIHHLLKNSVKAMPKGGDICIKTSIKTKGIFISFTDTGLTINDETRLKAFQPFCSTKVFEAGRDLEMNGVYNIIKKHHGDITIKSSELGKGNTIEIVLPLSNKDDKNTRVEDLLNNQDALNVLWVDDDLDIRENASELVQLIGHKCDTANGGEEALLLIKQNTYDFIFTDIGMPNINGWELSDAIRKKIGSKVKIVVVSGWDIDKNIKSKYGVNFVLQKPFTMKDLEIILTNV